MNDTDFMLILKAKVQAELNKYNKKEKSSEYDKGMKTAYENVIWLIDRRVNPKM